MKLSRESLKLAAKTFVGLLLLAYVLRSKMIDFSSVGKLLLDPVNFLIGMSFLSASMLLCAIRWYLLVRAQGLDLSFQNVVSLTMIGNFFNTFMPGSVGGDLIKAWYVAGRTPQTKTRGIFTVLLDRVVGLAVIIFYAATALLFFTGWLKEHSELRLIANFIWAFTILAVGFGALFYSPAVWKWAPFTKVIDLMRRAPLLEKLIDASLLYRNHFTTIISALALSAVSILGINLFYWLQGNALGIPLSLTEYFFVAPIVMVVSAVPLLPGGIGTGQVAFFTLFQWMGIANPGLGGALCTVVQVYYIIFNCFGAIFYLRFKRQPSNQNAAAVPL